MDQQKPPFGDENAEQKPRRTAMYVRMGTEHQQYSVESQVVVIREYAFRRGIKIIGNYQSCV